MQSMVNHLREYPKTPHSQATRCAATMKDCKLHLVSHNGGYCPTTVKLKVFQVKMRRKPAYFQ